MRALVAALLVLLAPHPSSHAGTLLVDPGGAGDFLTIAPAIEAAASGDTVMLAPAIYTGEDNCSLFITDRSLTLTSRAGPDSTVIDLQYEQSGVRVEMSSSHYVCVRNLTFRNGGPSKFPLDCHSAYVDVAGCVFEDSSFGLRFINSDGAVTDCLFTGNETGMIANARGAIWIRDCQFLQNIGGYSGALRCAAGHVLLHDCTFEGNTARDNGGAINCWRGPVTISFCHFAGNSSQSKGGAIWFTSMYNPGSPTIEECTFSGNSATEGGAIYGWRSSGDISSCEFSGNAAELGGAVYVDNYYNGCPWIRFSSFTGNTARYGGGIYTTATAPRVVNCTFSDNTVEWYGAGVYYGAYPGGTPSRITGCVFGGGNRAHKGSGVALQNITVELNESTFYGNYADHGAVAVLDGSTATMSQCVLAHNMTGLPIATLESYSSLSRSTVYGNFGGDSLDVVDHSDVYLTDPLFCDIYNSDVGLCSNSVCLPDNNPWGVTMGARGLGCGPCENAVEATSWGAIKALYR